MSVANENRPVAIQVSGVKKMYRLGQIGGGTLQADLQSWFARVRGKEDPNTKIGEGERIKGQTFMALNGIDLTIYQGEAVGIIGSNGAGKSTLLKLLSKVTAPTEGEIDIYGRIASMLEVGTGFNGELTGRENVYMNGAILGMTKQEIDAKMEQIIEFSEVRDFIDTPVKRYSSGMFVKLAFSVAAHLDSEIMIMDEVLAVGDMAFQKKCLTKMREAAKQDGRTILYVSHNMNTIRQLCDRCIVLEKGKVLFEGDIEEAIGIYLNTNAISKELITHFDFRNYDRKGFNNKYIVIESFDILNSKIAQFEQGSIVKMKIHFQSFMDSTNISLRFVFYSESFVKIGTAFLDRSINVRNFHTYDVEFSFDTKNLVPGFYYADIIIFLHDGIGNAKAMDILDKALNIEITEGKNYQYHWWRDAFGEIQFDNLLSSMK